MGKTILDRVQGFGLLVALLGLVSSVITFFDYELRVLMWIELWGSLVAWGIRLALIAGGLGLFFATGLLGGGDTSRG